MLAIGDNMEIYQGLDKKSVTGDVQMSVWTHTAYVCLDFTSMRAIFVCTRNTFSKKSREANRGRGGGGGGGGGGRGLAVYN